MQANQTKPELSSSPSRSSSTGGATYRAMCFRCYFHIASPTLMVRGANCPRCRFTLIVTQGRLEVTQESVERMFERLEGARSREERLGRTNRVTAEPSRDRRRAAAR